MRGDGDIISPPPEKINRYFVYYPPKGFDNLEHTLDVNWKSKVDSEADSALTYSVIGLISPDKMTGALTHDVGEDVGSYAIRQGALATSRFRRWLPSAARRTATL